MNHQDLYRVLQLKYGAVAYDLKRQRRMTPAQLGEAMREFEGKLSDRSVETEAQADAQIAALRAKYAKAPKRGGIHALVPIEQLRAKAAKRLAAARKH